MIAICYKCGSTKSTAVEPCKSCSAVPRNYNELALSLMLTDRFLQREKLMKAARSLRNGQPISLPPEVKAAVLGALQGVRSKEGSELSQGTGLENARSQQRAEVWQGMGWKGWGIIAVIASLLFLLYHPWPHFQWASFQNSVRSYGSFATRFPSSDLTKEANERIRILREDNVWDSATGNNQIDELRSYLRVYPDGKHLDAAKQQIAGIADQRWKDTSKTESKTEIQTFLKDYPETTMIAKAEARIVEIADQRWRGIQKTAYKSEIESFLKDWPETTMTAEAKARIVEMADQRWRDIATTESTKAEIQKFLKDWPETTMTAKAEARIVEIAEQRWKDVSVSRSIADIRNYLSAFPEAKKSREAEARIQHLLNDWDWVREQDDLDHYKRFITAFPRHTEKEWIEKRIIDLEVKKIAAGEFGEMPKAQPLSYGGAAAEVTVENQTGYVLTVRYSGPDSKKLVIPVGATHSVSLPPGDYQIAASVSAANVSNYYGKDTMKGGKYSSNFFIRSSFGGSSFTPSRER